MINHYYQLIIDPFQFQFMRHALIMAMILGIASAFLSCFIVLRGWSLMADAISHAILPGVVLASYFSIPLAIGAFISGLACSVFSNYFVSHSRITQNTILGIVFSGMLALGFLLFALLKPAGEIIHIFFGSILAMENYNFWQGIGLSIIVIVVLSLKWKDYLLYIFDAVYANAIGLSAKYLNYSLLILLTLLAVAAVQSVGIILVIGYMIIPGMTGLLISYRFPILLFTAIGATVLSSILGIYLSFYQDANASASIVLMQCAFFMIAGMISLLKRKIIQLRS